MGEDIIQSFIEALGGLSTAVAAGSVGIIAIAALFVGMRLGKRLLNTVDDVEPHRFIAHNGEVYEDGQGTGEHVDWVVQGWDENEEDAEELQPEDLEDDTGEEGECGVQCLWCGHDNTPDEADADQLCSMCNYPLEP